MTKGIEINRQDEDDATRVSLRGAIDAEFSAADPFGGSKGVLIIDLDGVDRITSFGIRDWVDTVKASASTYVGYINVRPQLIGQFNMVSGFAGPGELISFYVPWICDECEHEEQTLLDLRHSYDVVSSGTLPERPCPKCGSELELDDVAESYFAHASGRPPPHPPPEAEAIIDGKPQPKNKASFKIRKEVAGEVTGIWLSGPITRKSRLKRLLVGLEGQVVVVCQGITEIAPDAMERFATLLAHNPDYQIWLARVPQPYAARLGQEAAGRVVSFSAEYDCVACGRRDEVLEIGPAEASVSESLGRLPCPACGGVVTPRLDRAASPHLKLLLATEVDKNVRAYLTSRPGAAPPSLSDDDPGRFTLLKRIGQGGMAEVFLARRMGPEGFEKKVVIKRILPEFSKDARFVEMFLAEARTAARIDHPHVVQIFDLGADGSTYYLVMEYVRGWDLRTILSTAKRLGNAFPVEFVARVGADMCAGLHAAHTLKNDDGTDAGIVHRDVSPHNVLISKEGAVKISDFGIARAIDAQDGKRELRGKILYMAPEQIDAARGAINAATDVFAAGIVMYEMLAGDSPFRRGDKISSIRAVLGATISDIRELRADVPDTLADVIMGALSRDQADRYQSALAFQLRIEEAMAAMGKPATTAYFAAYLEGLRREGDEFTGELSRPMNTPSSTSTSATGDMEAAKAGEGAGSATLIDFDEPSHMADVDAPTNMTTAVVSLGKPKILK